MIALIGFLILFSAVWLAVCGFLVHAARWPALQERFPDREEAALKTLRMQSGVMGAGWPRGVNFNGCMTFSACQTGLRISLWKLFALFSKPIFVPWSDIHETTQKVLFIERARLGFGQPEIGQLTIDSLTWGRLAQERPGGKVSGAGLIVETPSAGPGRRLFIEWLIAVGFFGTFLAVGSRLDGGGSVPPLTAYGFPAAFFGMIQLLRFGQLSR